jgi:hypothetical protein
MLVHKWRKNQEGGMKRKIALKQDCKIKRKTALNQGCKACQRCRA